MAITNPDVELTVETLMEMGLMTEEGCARFANMIRSIRLLASGNGGSVSPAPVARRGRRPKAVGALIRRAAGQRLARGQLPKDIKSVLRSSSKRGSEIVAALLERPDYKGREKQSFYTQAFTTMKNSPEFTQDSEKRWSVKKARRKASAGRKKTKKGKKRAKK